MHYRHSCDDHNRVHRSDSFVHYRNCTETVCSFESEKSIMRTMYSTWYSSCMQHLEILLAGMVCANNRPHTHTAHPTKKRLTAIQPKTDSSVN